MRTSGGYRAFGALAVVAGLVACGGGGGGMAGIDGTGIGPTQPGTSPAVAVGTVTAFGSVFVNGIHFDTSSATFTIDGRSGVQGDLGVGDVVTVTGTIDDSDPTQGTATTVVFDAAVEGPVQSIDTSVNGLVVLGQSVEVSATTSFDVTTQPQSLDGLSVGDVIEVSGLVRSDGTIDATRIDRRPASTEWELTGLVSGLDQGALTFVVNGQLIDYGAAMVQSFPGGAISNGDLVEVRGAPALGASGELVASIVEFEEGPPIGAAGDRMEVEGFITRFADPMDFDVAGMSATTTAQTVFEDGAAGDLGLDVEIEIEGEIDATGVLVATKVEIHRSRAIRLFAAIDSTLPATSGAAGTGSFVALGVSIDVDALTRREDTRDDVSPFGVAELAAGDWVEVRGTETPAGSGRVVASLIERRDDGNVDETELRGFVTGAMNPDVTILGVTIRTDASTIFRDVDGNSIPASQFFSTVAAGGGAASLIEARGVETAPQFIAATQVGFEQ